MKKLSIFVSVLFFAALCMTSCSFFSSAKISMDKLYMIEKMPTVYVKKPRKSKVLLITQIDSIPLYDTTQMVYSKQPYQVGYYAKNRWAETPGQMLTPLLVQTLQNTRRFRYVAQSPYIGRADYVLSTQILKFQQNYNCRPPTFDLYARVQIFSLNRNRPIATDIIKVEQPLVCEGPYAGALAANLATANLLRQIAYFTVKHL